MKTRSTTFGPLALGLSVLLLSGTAAGLTGVGFAIAGARDQSHVEKRALEEAAATQKWLASGRSDLAVRHAEAAVGFQPQVAEYRVLLGQSYLKGGRFASARDAFADALTLDARNGRAALQFALMQIATGDWAGARKTIDAHPDTIGIADRGLALALAGDPAAAVELLAPAARTIESDAKLRQNLALSLALAGRWQEAKTIVAIDVAPDQVDKRILEWANFSHPKSAYDQVAALLNVTPAYDPGLPIALALSGSVPAVAAADPVDAYMPGKAVDTAVAAQAAPVVEPAPIEVATVKPSVGTVVFGERREVVQPLPVAVAEQRLAKVTKTVATARPVAVAAGAPRMASKGKFYVQLGAYDNAAVARDAWRRAGRFRGFAGQTPQGMSISTRAGNLYRLSVGGYARSDAVALCTAYRASGGTCFVRSGAGDQIALWARGRELALR